MVFYELKFDLFVKLYGCNKWSFLVLDFDLSCILIKKGFCDEFLFYYCLCSML